MPADPTDRFTDLKDPKEPDEEYYPGSKRKRVDFKKERKEKKEAESANRPWYESRKISGSFKGVDQDFYLIGALAQALGKKPVTIRNWIAQGWLPKARFRTPKRAGTRGDAGLRLWTRIEIETIVRIAQEEKIVGDWHPDIASSNFPTRVREALRNL